MEKYKTEMMKYPELKRSATLPKFQRRLVWSDKQKEDFIETLKKGYPFGSILVYKYPESSSINIIDGLQRYSTMNEYSESPNKYFKIEKYIEEIYGILFPDDSSPLTAQKIYKKKIESIINDILNQRNHEKQLDPAILNDRLVNEFSVLKNGEINREILNMQTKIFSNIDNYLDINSIQIPTVTFLGDESELAAVFENLNRGGKKLSKYQVFAAQWSEYELELDKNYYNTQILKKVIHRYRILNANRNIEIVDYDEAKMISERKVNLSEFCYALGSLIIDECTTFWNKSDREREDLANEIGYSTLGIILEVPNNKLHKIIDFRSMLNDSGKLESLIKSVLEIYQTINNYFVNYLRHPGTSDVSQGKIITNFQLMSYFAALWCVKFEPFVKSESLKIREKYRNDFEKTLNNFIYYFIYDILTKRWSGTGDSKLNEIYIEKNNRYKMSIDRDTLNNRLIEWRDETHSKSSVQFDAITKTIYTIFASFERNQFSSTKYDFEHIISRKKLKPYYKEFNIPAGSLGNMMFLQDRHNRSKKDQNLYQSLQPGSVYEAGYIELNVYPSQKEMDKIEVALEQNKFEAINKIISDRGQDIINILLKNLYS